MGTRNLLIFEQICLCRSQVGECVCVCVHKIVCGRLLRYFVENKFFQLLLLFLCTSNGKCACVYIHFSPPLLLSLMNCHNALCEAKTFHFRFTLLSNIFETTISNCCHEIKSLQPKFEDILQTFDHYYIHFTQLHLSSSYCSMATS